MINEWGFNFARIPTDYRFLIKNNNWDDIDESAMSRLDKAVEYGIKYNIHINLNLHRAPGYTVANPPEIANLWKDKEPQEAFARLWAYFAARYKNVPNEYLSFNLINEPANIDEASYAAVVKKASDAVWDNDRKRLIIADGLEWGTIPSDTIKGFGIPLAGRGYQPFTLTHYKAGWVNGAQDYPLPDWPKEAEGFNKQSLYEKHFKQWKDFLKNGGAAMIGEWGAFNKTPHDVVLRWMENCLEIFKELDLGWALWNLTGSFGILNSGRADVDYENFNGYKLDRKMLDLLLKYVD
ncbi:MAG: glycoside hydrolase family 5 protein [Treponema sp.]|nr:glycoside hydrolase family 5 protein [Treponema sp.]